MDATRRLENDLIPQFAAFLDGRFGQRAAKAKQHHQVP
jgi:hypothetical protein